MSPWDLGVFGPSVTLVDWNQGAELSCRLGRCPPLIPSIAGSLATWMSSTCCSTGGHDPGLLLLPWRLGSLVRRAPWEPGILAERA
jgi:hypothetical protein